MSTGEILNYAPRPAWHRRRKWRQAAMLAIIMTCLLVTWRWGPQVLKKIQLVYSQRQCLAYQAAPDMVVFEQDPMASAALLNSGKGYFASPPCGKAAYMPSCLMGFIKASQWGLQTLEPVFFLHERVSPSGLKRLVVVQCDPVWNPVLTKTNYFDRCAIEPGTLLSTPVSWTMPPWAVGKNGPIGPTQPGGPYLRFFAGQADSSDSSHFTIRYQLHFVYNNPVLEARSHDPKDDLGGTIDGWLRNSGNVELNIRDGPW